MKFLKLIIPFFIIILTPNVFAASIKSDTYSQKNGFVIASRYDYTTNNLMGDDFSVVSTGSYGTTYSGKSYYFQFNVHKTLTAGKTYDLKISSTTADFTSKINIDRVVPLCYSSFSSSFNEYECSDLDIQVVSVIRENISSGQSKSFTIRFRTTNDIVYKTYWGFKIAGGLNNLTGVSNFKISDIDLKEVNSSDNTETIINNNNQNTQNIIDSQTNNTQNIIDNQNQNTQQITDTIQEYMGGPCPNLINVGTISLDKENHRTQIVSLTDTLSAGTYTITYDYLSHNSPTTSVQLYINTNSSQTYSVSLGNSGRNTFTIPNSFNRMYFLITSDSAAGSTATISNIMLVNGSVGMSYCAFGTTTSKIDETNKSINEVNDTLTDSNVDSGTGSGFFNDFSSNDFGLSSIITIPLNTIQSLTSKSCLPLQVPIPFTNSNLTLPCMTEIYEQKFGSVYNLWKIVSFGIVAYLIVIDIFHIVKGFKDPESDKVEVLDL